MTRLFLHPQGEWLRVAVLAPLLLLPTVVPAITGDVLAAWLAVAVAEWRRGDAPPARSPVFWSLARSTTSTTGSGWIWSTSITGRCGFDVKILLRTVWVVVAETGS